MKILILYTYNKGLLSEFFQEFSAMLHADGFEVINFYLKHRKSFIEQQGVTIFGEKRGNFSQNYKAIYQIIEKIKPDVVISNFSYINPAILFGKLLGVKRNIAWFHTAYGHTKPSRLKVWNKTLYLNMANVVLANSELLQNEMHNVYQVPKHKIKRIPFWTNIANYRSETCLLQITKNDEIINIGCPGRLVTDKNQSMVIEAVYQLKQRHEKQIRLYIAGNGQNRKDLETLVQELDLEQEVVFLGLLDVQKMTTFYDAMDVVVLPSFHEAFGLVFIEAIAMGTPVLVSRAFGALDFVDDEKFPLETFSFNPKDVSELIDKLEPYLKNSGHPADYFKTMYRETFEKDVIYHQLKEIILNEAHQ